MIFVPLLKTRQEELRVAEKLNMCFSDKIIPLFEIIDDLYETRYKVDPITGDFLYKKNKKRKTRIKAEPTDTDRITLKKIDCIVNHKDAFIDYFRFTIKKYGSNINVNKVVLSRKMNEQLPLYKSRINEINQYSNFIPVVSIKDGFFMPKYELKEFLVNVKKTNKRIALRLTDEYLNEYQNILEVVLDKEDFILFDVEEQSPNVKFIELEELSEMNIKSKIILLNSPRKIKVKNGDYPENDYTNLIDNCAREITTEYELHGYGDYCGLKDTLPTNDGSNGTGAALALLYDYSQNAFWAYTNKDTSQGMGGYKKLIPTIKLDCKRFDPDNQCYGYEKINELTGTGNWSTWHNICLRRYISQVYLNIY